MAAIMGDDHSTPRQPNRWTQVAAALPLDVRHAVDAQGQLNVSVTCRACGYNLRGLHWEADCPECGQSVHSTIASDYLATADPRWLTSLYRGMNLLWWGVLLGALMVVAFVVVSISYAPRSWVGILAWALAMPPWVVIAMGMWRVTRRDPGLVFEAPVTVRGIARWSGLAAVGFAIVTGPLYMLIDAMGYRSADLSATGVAMVCLIAGGVMLMVFGFNAILLGRNIPNRAGQHHLVASLNTMGWIYLVIVACVSIAAIAISIGGMGVCAALPLLLVSGYLVIINGGHTLYMTFQFRRMLKRYVPAED